MGSLLETPTPPVKPPPADLPPGLNPPGSRGSTVLTAGLNAPFSQTAVEQTTSPLGHAPLPPATPVRAKDKGATILTSGLRNRPDGRLRKGADSAAIAARGRDREIDRNRMRANSPSVRRSVGTDMLMGLNNEYLAAQQGTSPVVRRADGAFNYRRAQQREQDLFDEQRVVRDPSRFVVLNDPGTNRLTVFDRSPETDEGGVARMGRLLMLGLATDPIRFSKGGLSVAKGTVGSAPKVGKGEGRYLTLGNRTFVALEDGTADFGQIDQTIAKAIGRQPAPIRLPRGDHQFGEVHISRPERANQLRRAGFDNPAEFVRIVASEFTEIWEAKGTSLLLVKRSKAKAHSLFVEIKRLDGDAAYEVISGGAFRGSFPRGGERKLLWDRERTSAATTGE